MAVVAGVDFGTLSVRVSIVDSQRGRLGSAVAEYPLVRKKEDPDHATQSHSAHMSALVTATRNAVREAGVSGHDVAAIALDTTGSSVIPVAEGLVPLDDYYLWCDHRAKREAAEITATARREKLEAIEWCGGVYSSEWGFAKLLHWLRHNPERRGQMATALEHCDMVAAVLCGITDAAAVPRSICAMGHKWMWNAALGGLPPEEFLTKVDPLFAGVRAKLGGRYATSDQNVVGTSTCIMAIAREVDLIPGVCGVVKGSIHPAYYGVEAGLSATGDIFEAIARRAGSNVAALSKGVESYRAGQSGLLRLTWDNGDRTVLVNAELGGVTLGWNLTHTPQDELFAAIEGTAFHTRIILERMAEHGVSIRRVINGGGVPQKNETLNRVYANVFGKPVLVPEDEVTSLGSAIMAFMAAGVFPTIEAAQQALCPRFRTVDPDPQESAVYERLFPLYRKLYFGLGSPASEAVAIGNVLPELRKLNYF
jgi:L-ribulokinase